jgi:hypothetical protein
MFSGTKVVKQQSLLSQDAKKKLGQMLATISLNNNLLVCSWMMLPVGVRARAIVGSTLIALMPPITLGLLHPTPITGARNPLMPSSGS